MSGKDSSVDLETKDEVVETSAAEIKKGIRGITTTLDFIEFGTPETTEAEFKKTPKERRRLPDNVDSKSLYRDIGRIAWPSLTELILGALVNMVDMMMVGALGPEEGPQAIAAIGLATQPRFLMMTLVMALNTGTTAVIARARGSNQHERASDIFRQAIILGTLIAVICSVAGTFSSRFMISFMAAGGISQSTIDLGIVYFNIQSITFIVPALSFIITAALRGTGNSKPCMIYNVIANLVNIVGNWLLISGNLGFPRMGVAGAAIATVFGQFVGTVIALSFVISGRYYIKLRINLKSLFKFDKNVVGGMVKVGVPAMIEQLVMRVGVVIYTRTISTLGDINLSTHHIALNIQSLSMMTGQGFATSATALVGQSLGRQRLDMAEHYSRRCRTVAMSVSFVLAIIFILFRAQLIGLYNANEQIIRTGSLLMLFVAFLQPIQSSQFVLGGVLRGAGDTKVTAFIILITTVIIRTALGYLFVTILGDMFLVKNAEGVITSDYRVLGAWLAIAIDQTLRSFLFLLRYNQGKWKKIKLL